jgi:hypothetical protein
MRDRRRRETAGRAGHTASWLAQCAADALTHLSPTSKGLFHKAVNEWSAPHQLCRREGARQRPVDIYVAEERLMPVELVRTRPRARSAKGPRKNDRMVVAI